MSKKPFSIFGFGKAGVPHGVRTMLRHGLVCGDRALALAQVAEIGASPEALQALAADLISPHTGEPMLTPQLREFLSVPAQVRVRDFVLVAGREAFALALTIARDADSPVDRLCETSARVREGRWGIKELALHEASKKNWQWDGDNLVEAEPRKIRRSGRDAVASVDRKTIRNWRATPEYLHMVREVATWLLFGLHVKPGTTPMALSGRAAEKMDSMALLASVHEQISERFEFKLLTVPADITDQNIRNMVTRIPEGDILELVGEVPTVWATNPNGGRGIRTAFVFLLLGLLQEGEKSPAN